MVYKYDDAVIALFRKIFGDDTISLVPPERARDVKAQLQSDEVKFPLLSLNRNGYSIQSNKINWHSSRMGVMESIGKDNKVNVLHNIPIRLEYQLDVYTIDKISGDEIIRELIFYLLLHPTLLVEIPYGLDTEHKFNLFLDDDVVDNSEIAEHVNSGVLYRNTITFYSDDAYLFANTPTDLVVSGGASMKIEED